MKPVPSLMPSATIGSTRMLARRYKRREQSRSQQYAATAPNARLHAPTPKEWTAWLENR